MNILETILSAQGGNAVNNLGTKFGLSGEQTTSAITSLLPALMSGMKSNVQQEGGLDSLLGALAGGQHQRYLDTPESVYEENAVQEGNGILGHLLGSKDVSRQVASRAAESTGVAPAILKQMLPVVATMLMGSLSKQTQGGNLAAAFGNEDKGSFLSMLTPMLDQDGDGSIVDDVAGMLGGFFKR